MKTTGIVFGVAPILMQRFDGGIRIIHPNGEVEYATFFDGHEMGLGSAKGCTSRPTQRAAYKACIEYDDCGPQRDRRYSKFLGYL